MTKQHKQCAGTPHGAQGRPFRLHRADHDPRAAALSALSQVLFAGCDSQAALDEVLRAPALVPTDKRLCTELLYGVLRRYLSLQDFSAAFFRKAEKLPSEMRLAIYLALYEMCYLRTPHHASVNWAVGHVRHRFGQGLAKVANGSLRAMQRALDDRGNALRIEAGSDSEEEALSRCYAMPAWIIRLWMKSYGQEKTHALLSASAQPAPAGLRLNRACPNWEKDKGLLMARYAAKSPAPDAAAAAADTGKVLLPVGSCGLAFSPSLPWEARELLATGKASRQSAASYAILEAFSPGTWLLPIWDCCAGRGGKTLALLEQGIAVALVSDQSRQRLEALPQEYTRLGLQEPPCPESLPLPLEEAAAYLSEQRPNDLFGTILIDAPCSGLGTLSRRPEIRLRRSPQDLAELVALQRRILDAAFPRLRSGGSLVYLTCTMNPEENQEQIKNFISRHPQARLLSETQTDPDSPLREFFYGARIIKA